MEKEKEGERVLVTGNENPLKELATKWREYTDFLEKWTYKQSLPVKTAILTTVGGIDYAITGVALRILLENNEDISERFKRAHPSKNRWIEAFSLRTRLIDARNFALCGATQASIYSVMETLRGKKDTATCMLAGFSSGVTLSLAYRARDPRVIGLAGAVFGLYHVGSFKYEEMNRGHYKPAKTRTYVAEEEKVSLQENSHLQTNLQSYYRTRQMLSSLGLEDYENNFKKRLFTDKTLPLLTDRDLQDMDIPAGARLLILDYIKREDEMKKDVWN